MCTMLYIPVSPSFWAVDFPMRTEWSRTDIVMSPDQLSQALQLLADLLQLGDFPCDRIPRWLLEKSIIHRTVTTTTLACVELSSRGVFVRAIGQPTYFLEPFHRSPNSYRRCIGLITSSSWGKEGRISSAVECFFCHPRYGCSVLKHFSLADLYVHLVAYFLLYWTSRPTLALPLTIPSCEIFQCCPQFKISL